jgi:hypothetical protein
VIHNELGFALCPASSLIRYGRCVARVHVNFKSVRNRWGFGVFGKRVASRFEHLKRPLHPRYAVLIGTSSPLTGLPSLTMISHTSSSEHTPNGALGSSATRRMYAARSLSFCASSAALAAAQALASFIVASCGTVAIAHRISQSATRDQSGSITPTTAHLLKYAGSGALLSIAICNTRPCVATSVLSASRTSCFASHFTSFVPQARPV